MKLIGILLRFRIQIGFLGQLYLLVIKDISRLANRNWASDARKNSLTRRRRQHGRNSQFEQLPNFWLADKNDKDEDAGRDVDNVEENPMSELAVA